MVNSGRHLEGWLDRPVAAVYRGQVACDGCAESVAELLRKSPLRYKVHYLGPDEDHDISLPLLSHLDLFAWPGGGGALMCDRLSARGYADIILKQTTKMLTTKRCLAIPKRFRPT